MADAALTEAEVVDAPEAGRYELRLGGRVIGFVAYRRRNDRIVFTHTEVDVLYEGRGLGSRLAAAALEDVRGKGLVVVPLCPFIAQYIEEHPEYHELVATSCQARSGAASISKDVPAQMRENLRFVSRNFPIRGPA